MLRPRAVVLNAVALVLLSVAILSGIERRSGFTADEGSYAIQAKALASGGWDIHWSARSIDPGGASFPYHSGVLAPDAEFAYVSHPLWPVALSIPLRLGVPETIGLRLLGLVALWSASLCAYVLTITWGYRQAASWAFWATATSPLLANSLMLWSHVPAAATGGLLVLAVTTCIQRQDKDPRWAAIALAAAGVGVALRSEFALLVGAMALVLIGSGVQRRSRQRAALGAALLILGAVVVAVEAAWIRTIVGPHSFVERLQPRDAGGPGWLLGRIRGAFESTMAGGFDTPVASLLSLLGLGVMALAVLAFVRGDLRHASVLLTTAVLVQALRLGLFSQEPIKGLLVAWPVIVFAAAGRSLDESVRLMVGVVALLTVGVFASQYEDGGGLQFGGRLLQVAIVPLAALVGIGLQRVVEAIPRSVPLVIAGLAVAATTSIVTTDHVRRGNFSVVEALDEVGAPVVVADNAHTARFDWVRWPQRCWVLLAADDVAAHQVLRDSLPSRIAYAMWSPEKLGDIGYLTDDASDLVGEAHRLPNGAPNASSIGCITR